VSENTSTAIVKLCRVGHRMMLRYDSLYAHATFCPSCGAFLEEKLSKEPECDEDGYCLVCRAHRVHHTLASRLPCGIAERITDPAEAERIAREKEAWWADQERQRTAAQIEAERRAQEFEATVAAVGTSTAISRQRPLSSWEYDSLWNVALEEDAERDDMKWRAAREATLEEERAIARSRRRRTIRRGVIVGVITVVVAVAVGTLYAVLPEDVSGPPSIIEVEK
jgi:hypothetical protein